MPRASSPRRSPSRSVAATIDIPGLLDRLCYRYPSLLVDAITGARAGPASCRHQERHRQRRVLPGAFPGRAAAARPSSCSSRWRRSRRSSCSSATSGRPNARVYLRGVDDAKFRRQVVPGDRLRLEITLEQRRTALARARAVASVGDQIVAEADLLLGYVLDETDIHPTAIVHPRARIGRGCTIGAHALIGADVTLGENCKIGASCRDRGHDRRSATTPRSFRSPRSA